MRGLWTGLLFGTNWLRNEGLALKIHNHIISIGNSWFKVIMIYWG